MPPSPGGRRVSRSTKVARLASAWVTACRDSNDLRSSWSRQVKGRQRILWPDHASLTLASCLATRRCMNLGPSFSQPSRRGERVRRSKHRASKRLGPEIPPHGDRPTLANRVRPYHSLGGLLLTSMVCAKVLPSLADDCIRPSERPCSPITLKRKPQKL